jgi:nucleotide-binding universal stress UspA family protein
MFRNILVAIDGSAHAARALEEAVDLAQAGKARLTVITCVPDPAAWLIGGAAYSGGIDFEALSREAEREAQGVLDAAVQTIPQDLPVTKILTHGRAARRILEQTENGHHDLVMMGSRGRGEVRSLLLGSVSHEVLNASRTAVLILHAPPQEVVN